MQQYESGVQEYDTTSERSPRDKTIAYLRSSPVGLDAVFAMAIADMAGEIDPSDDRQWRPIRRKLSRELGDRPAEQVVRRLIDYYRSSDPPAVNWR